MSSLSLSIPRRAIQRLTSTSSIQSSSSPFHSSSTQYSAPRRGAVRKVLASRALKWLGKEGKSYEIKISPENGEWVKSEKKFVAFKDTPFPMNPLFKPNPIVNDRIKEEIYQEYMSNPTEWSPRKLAEKYKLSLIRVEAILRLKALEKQWESTSTSASPKNNTNDETSHKPTHHPYHVARFPIQKTFTQSMEKLMEIDSYSTTSYREPEPLRLISSMRLKPLLHYINEEEALTPKDAAELLQVEPYANIEYRLDKDADALGEKVNREIRHDALGEADEDAERAKPKTKKNRVKELVDQNMLVTGLKAMGKHPFMFTDTSQVLEVMPDEVNNSGKKGKAPKFFVRDVDGALREANKVEKLKKKASMKVNFHI